MHGRKRDEYKAIHRDPYIIEKLSKKAQAWHTLQNELIQRRNEILLIESDYGTPVITTTSNTLPPSSSSSSSIQNEAIPVVIEEGSSDVTNISKSNDDNNNNSNNSNFMVTTLVLLEKAITVNPDPIWLWNFRRTLIQKQLTTSLLLLVNTTTSSTSTTTTTNGVGVTEDSTSNSILFNQEHIITQIGLQNNPKAYAVWHYRKWCIQQQIMIMMMTSDVVQQQQELLLQQELHLCSILLQKDERNFHCWSYRRFIISCLLYICCSDSSSNEISEFMTGEWILPNVIMNISNEDDNDHNMWMGAQISIRNDKLATELTSTTGYNNNNNVDEKHFEIKTNPSTTTATITSTNNVLQKEWEFTTTKIYENFSNFSAFHYRSKLLPLMIMMIQQLRHNSNDGDGDDNDENSSDITTTTTRTFQMIKDEFDLITNAIYTEPDDQTAWWYQVFLFHYMMEHIFIFPTRTNDMDDDDDDAVLQQQQQQQLITKYNEQIIYPHIQQVRELQNETSNCSKWVFIGLLQCLEYQKKYNHYHHRATTATTMTTTTTSADSTTKTDLIEINRERRSILQALIRIDPDRKERYRYKLRQIH